MDYSPVYKRFTFVEPKKVQPIQPLAVSLVRSLFSTEECDRILLEGLAWKSRPAAVYTSLAADVVDPKLRQGNIYTIESDSISSLWFLPKINDAIKSYKQHTDGSPTIGGKVEVQLVEYTNPGDHFNKHRDTEVNPSEMTRETHRKISLTIELTDNTQYEGANLRFIEDDGKTIRPVANKGDAFIFPSWRRHQVKPLVSGVRHALVCWYHGPFWR